jgi:hypothetical protein
MMKTDPDAPGLQPNQWLAEQQRLGRQLTLIVDTVSAPQTIATLFTLAPIRDYRRLFQGTEFDDLLEHSPWLIRIDQTTLPALNRLLLQPDDHWGWLASATTLDLDDQARHWRDRMVISEGDQRWFYRFQDNRVIARHLAALHYEHIPLLLGPLNEALCWNGDTWLRFENSRPALYLPPFATPWADVSEPADISEAIELRALKNWLWQEHSTATASLPISVSLDAWLKQQLDLAEQWRWDRAEQIRFLVQHKLDPAVAHHNFWDSQPDETPADHFQRVQREVVTLTAGQANS